MSILPENAVIRGRIKPGKNVPGRWLVEGTQEQREHQIRETCVFMYLPSGKENPRNAATIHGSPSNTQRSKVEIHLVSSSL